MINRIQGRFVNDDVAKLSVLGVQKRLIRLLRRSPHGFRKILEFPVLYGVAYQLHIHGALVNENPRIVMAGAFRLDRLLDGCLQVVVIVAVQEHVEYGHILHQF